MNGKSTVNFKDLRISEYGDQLILPATNAILRGSGMYNPGPKYEQSFNRGPTQSASLAIYGASNYYNQDQTLKAANNDYSEKTWAQAPDKPLIDVPNQQKFVVGSTGIHTEKPGSWNTPDFQYSRGTDRYQVWALNSMQLTPNVLVYLFFSEDNVNYLQNKLISEVRRIRGVEISPQSVDELLIIMRNKYLYALYGWLPSSGNPNKVMARGTILNPNGLAYYGGAGGCSSLEEQVKRLNQSVLEECLKQVLSGIMMYQKYYSDASSLPLPLDRSILTTMKGSKSIQENLGFTSGKEFSEAASAYNERYNII